MSEQGHEHHSDFVPRRFLLAEFTTPDEAEKLHVILQRIGDGLPTTQLIDQARNGP